MARRVLGLILGSILILSVLWLIGSTFGNANTVLRGEWHPGAQGSGKLGDYWVALYYWEGEKAFLPGWYARQPRLFAPTSGAGQTVMASALLCQLSLGAFLCLRAVYDAT